MRSVRSSPSFPQKEKKGICSRSRTCKTQPLKNDESNTIIASYSDTKKSHWILTWDAHRGSGHNLGNMSGLVGGSGGKTSFEGNNSRSVCCVTLLVDLTIHPESTQKQSYISHSKPQLQCPKHYCCCLRCGSPPIGLMASPQLGPSSLNIIVSEISCFSQRVDSKEKRGWVVQSRD